MFAVWRGQSAQARTSTNPGKGYFEPDRLELSLRENTRVSVLQRQLDAVVAGLDDAPPREIRAAASR